MRAVVCCVAAALVAGVSTSQLSACFLSGDDCKCRPTPERPSVQAELPINEASAYDAIGNDDVLPTDPRGGTIEVEGDRVVIRYTQEGRAREVTYDVSGPETP